MRNITIDLKSDKSPKHSDKEFFMSFAQKGTHQ
ncbi:MAG: hypothetical protein RL113_1096 [Pseudomonadota bacterium]